MFQTNGRETVCVSCLMFENKTQTCFVNRNRAAKSAGIGELDSLIAKDLIDSENLKHTLFCRKIAFAAIYVLFRDNITIF